MKTIISISFLIGATLLPLLGIASGNLYVSMSNVGNRKATLEISHIDDKVFEVSIVDEMGQLIYNHQTNESKPEFNKRFDFSGLEEGTYKLSVKADGGSKEQMITIGRDGISYGKEITKTDPFFSYKNDQLTLTFINHQNEMMKIFLYEKGELVWEKDLDSALSISKIFDLANLNRGEFKVVFGAGEEIYEYKLVR